mmetsp:Transcript_38958/g.101993  ORF Transcript_38958/g.101993 Transcript_38958/m.101993 type:complete len:405 (+) Transcript_38958:360-1574(+)
MPVTVTIAGLHATITQDEVSSYFGKFGGLHDVHRVTGKGSWLVQFSALAGAQAAAAVDHSGWAKGLELHLSPTFDDCGTHTPEASESSDTGQDEIEALAKAAQTVLCRLRSASSKLKGTFGPSLYSSSHCADSVATCNSKAVQTTTPYDSSRLAAVAEAASIAIPDGLWRCCDPACVEFLTALVQEIVNLRAEVARQQELCRTVSKAIVVPKTSQSQTRSSSFTRSRAGCEGPRSATNDSRGRSRTPSANAESASVRSAVRTTELSPGRSGAARSPGGSARQSPAVRPSSPPVLSRAHPTQVPGGRAAKVHVRPLCRALLQLCGEAAQGARPDQSPAARAGRSSGRAGSPRSGTTRQRPGVTGSSASRAMLDARSPGFGDTEATPLGIAMVNSRPSQGSLRRSL